VNHPFEASRALFPILAQKAQLSSCSQSALAAPVAAAVQDYLQIWAERGMDWGCWMQAVEEAKAGFARLINAAPGDVAVMGSVSDIASSVGSALAFTPQKNGIVVGEIDFPSIGHVWLAHEPRGARVRFVRSADGVHVDPQAYADAIDERTALVSISHVAYANGFLQDLGVLAGLAHAQDALLFVDAYQSVGAVHIDVQRTPVDILASGAQKFMLGCPGIAFVYVRPQVAQRLQPSNTGWFGRVAPFAFDIRRLDYAEGAARLNTGTPPMVNAYAARAAIGLLEAAGVPRIEAWLRHLSAVALAEAARLRLQLASPRDLSRKAANTAIRVGTRANEIERRLAAQGYVVAARNDVIRIAPHYYSTEEEVVGALRALAALTGA